jgi:hypothetical protein
MLVPAPPSPAKVNPAFTAVPENPADAKPPTSVTAAVCVPSVTVSVPWVPSAPSANVAEKAPAEWLRSVRSIDEPAVLKRPMVSPLACAEVPVTATA